MDQIEIKLVGLAELIELVDAVLRFVDMDILGRVYSTGAIGPRGERYELLVQHYRYQAAIHTGIWPTDESIAEDNTQRVIDYLERGLQALIDSSGRSMEALRSQVREALNVLYAEATTYPPRSSTYVRTGRLRESWEVELMV